MIMSQPDYDDLIPRMLQRCHTIAVVGLSANPARDSYQVARYMQAEGYRIVPVNPTYAGTEILGETCYPTLQKAADHLAEKGQKIDMVNCFRRADAIRTIAEEAIDIEAICLWTQLGIVDGSAAEMASKAGLIVIMDRCLKVEHGLL